MAYNHSAQDITVDGETFKVIRTKIDYIRPRIINQPLTNTNFLGINGGFFSSPDYSAPPNYGVSISWTQYGTNNHLYNGTSTENYPRGTLYIYADNNGVQHAQVQPFSKVSEVQNQITGATLKAIIGGGDLGIGIDDDVWYDEIYKGEEWDNVKFGIIDTALLSTRRSGIGIRTENGECIAYLAVSTTNARLVELKHLFEYIDCYAAIFLDGSGSSQYQYKDENNAIVSYGGTDNPSRYIWNMIQIINVQ